MTVKLNNFSRVQNIKLHLAPHQTGLPVLLLATQIIDLKDSYLVS
jgi:hypothetical protein